MIKKASINREHYYELIGTEAIFRRDIVCAYTGDIKYNKGDKSIILRAVEDSTTQRWATLSEVLNYIQPRNCWKFGYYTDDTPKLLNIKETKEYDMPTAFVYYVLSCLRDLDNEKWNVSAPKWTKYPKNPDIETKRMIERFNKKTEKVI